ncbi:metal ABC transporter ATP-binding protein [Lacticaseibacillus nasuensis]|uniref:ABC transporter ATP-binding protein n=1 Tax=Lacticaseibacillus nasuensis JCM 17158 TaxID=1291734 RepID=A0A0R1K2C5_9LACO|nr:metal ABC transporter ATP-binding protein [Lacticaseibacillus nasuensis]KRK74282.1 ABC transporter ATP-binding protein [Lacticaseibacillus nasuensis JCM 17158]
MLTIKNLTVAYAATPVFTDVAVTFPAGKITGIIGPNGAGKSTLIKAILGLIKVASGTVAYNDQPVQAMRKRIAYVEQRKDLDLTFPIDVLAVVMTGTYAKLGLFRNPGVAERQASLAALAQVGLSEFAHRQIGQLSGGQLQRVFVARAMVQEADIVILDEPFVGIDLPSEAAIMAILQAWRAAGKTIIVVHHDLNKVTTYFDELVIMNHGIIAAGPVAEVYTARNLTAAFSADLANVLFTPAEATS